jgi:hypothetical protein
MPDPRKDQSLLCIGFKSQDFRRRDILFHHPVLCTLVASKQSIVGKRDSTGYQGSPDENFQVRYAFSTSAKTSLIISGTASIPPELSTVCAELDCVLKAKLMAMFASPSAADWKNTSTGLESPVRFKSLAEVFTNSQRKRLAPENGVSENQTP